ncbi:MAG: hypothetical protein VYE77_09730, partial [Planctomycetota bacterium]|nr:hypothetical protein [Planctomycetota bacterium]
MKTSPLVAALLCLPTVTAQQPDLLRLTSSEPRVIAYAKQLLGDPAPAPDEQGFRQLTVDADQQVAVAAAQPLPDGRAVSLLIRPGAWMERAQPAVAEIVDSLKTSLAAVGPLMGLPPQLGP